jgi:hypothetical protein
MIQHPLLIQILGKYGVPDSLVEVVKKMYNNCTVSYKLEKENINISYNTGVQQGNNASPVLFAYIMQAFLDTLKMEMKPYEFRFFKPPQNGNLKVLNGRLTGQPTTSKGSTFEFNNVFFTDDRVFITESLEEIEILTPILIEHFKRLGMQMHVVTISKTKALFFPESLSQRSKKTNYKRNPAPKQPTCLLHAKLQIPRFNHHYGTE